MDKRDLIDEIAGGSADAFASFQRDLIARRTQLLLSRLETLSTAELRARGLELLDRAKRGIAEQREFSRRQVEHIEWVKALGDDIDDADVALARDLSRDSDWNANIVTATAAEMTATIPFLTTGARSSRTSTTGQLRKFGNVWDSLRAHCGSEGQWVGDVLSVFCPYTAAYSAQHAPTLPMPVWPFCWKLLDLVGLCPVCDCPHNAKLACSNAAHDLNPQ